MLSLARDQKVMCAQRGLESAARRCHVLRTMVATGITPHILDLGTWQLHNLP